MHTQRVGLSRLASLRWITSAATALRTPAWPRLTSCAYVPPRLPFVCRTVAMASSSRYGVIQTGSLYKDDFKLFFKDSDGAIVSPFHDIPLYTDELKTTVNMVVEVPRWTNAKMEINVDSELNPIRQDVKKGKVRFVPNCYPFHGYIWNYGALPQTWEDPSCIDEDTNCRGDGDPIDVCEIGHRVKERGEVIEVKILGTIALIDEGETDWKLLAIDTKDPLAPQINDISDIRTHMPGLLEDTVKWFRIYKIPDGKPPNEFAFNGEAKNRDFALKVMKGAHDQWTQMMVGPVEPAGLSRATTVYSGGNKMSQKVAQDLVSRQQPAGPPQELDPIVDKWHFV